MHKCFFSMISSPIGWMSCNLQKCLCRRGERLLKWCIACNFFSVVAWSTWLFRPIQHISRVWPASWESRHWDSMQNKNKKKNYYSLYMTVSDLLQKEKNHCSLRHPCSHSDTQAFSLFQIADKTGHKVLRSLTSAEYSGRITSLDLLVKLLLWWNPGYSLSSLAQGHVSDSH